MSTTTGKEKTLMKFNIQNVKYAIDGVVNPLPLADSISLEVDYAELKLYGDGVVWQTLSNDKGKTGTLGLLGKDAEYEIALGRAKKLANGLAETKQKAPIKHNLYFETQGLNNDGEIEILKTWLFGVTVGKANDSFSQTTEDINTNNIEYPLTVVGTTLKDTDGETDYTDEKGNKEVVFLLTASSDDENYATFGDSVPVAKMPEVLPNSISVLFEEGFGAGTKRAVEPAFTIPNGSESALIDSTGIITAVINQVKYENTPTLNKIKLYHFNPNISNSQILIAPTMDVGVKKYGGFTFRVVDWDEGNAGESRSVTVRIDGMAGANLVLKISEYSNPNKDKWHTIAINNASADLMNFNSAKVALEGTFSEWNPEIEVVFFNPYEAPTTRPFKIPYVDKFYDGMITWADYLVDEKGNKYKVGTIFNKSVAEVTFDIYEEPEEE